jgi:hypothetical protein
MSIDYHSTAVYALGAKDALLKLGMGPTYLERASERVRKWMPKSKIGKGALAGGLIGSGMATYNLTRPKE